MTVYEKKGGGKVKEMIVLASTDSPTADAD
jgi:hypothetical protein